MSREDIISRSVLHESSGGVYLNEVQTTESGLIHITVRENKKECSVRRCCKISLGKNEVPLTWESYIRHKIGNDHWVAPSRGGAFVCFNDDEVFHFKDGEVLSLKLITSGKSNRGSLYYGLTGSHKISSPPFNEIVQFSASRESVRLVLRTKDNYTTISANYGEPFVSTYEYSKSENGGEDWLPFTKIQVQLKDT